MGMFDDLIPQGTTGNSDMGLQGVVRPGKSSGMFDDLLPQPAPQIDFNRPDDQVRADIAKLPDAQRQEALKSWADAYVAREREGGGVGQRVGDAVNRFARSVPGVGAWADELNAKTAELTGQSSYDEALAYQQARDRAIDATPTQTLATVPGIGDITTGGLEKTAGTVLGAFTMPGANIAKGVGFIPGATNAAVTGGAYGALEGAGTGSGMEDRLENAARQGGSTAAIAAPIGGVIGRIAGRALPGAADDVAKAAEIAQIDLPRAAAGGEGMADMATRFAAGKLGSIPMVGAPLQKATATARDQMETAGGRIAGEFAPGVTPASAGETVKSRISDWITKDSREELSKLYGKVETKFKTPSHSDLPNTIAAVQKLTDADRAAASAVNKPVADMLLEAVTRPSGMTPQGLMQLRTNIGAMIDDAMLPAAGTTKPALKQVYNSLTLDLQKAIRDGGGRSAVIAWNKASRTAKEFAEKREELTKIIGRDGSASPESVVDRIVTYAGSKSSADIEKLLKARSVMGGDAWNEVSAAAVARLGRDQSNAFNPTAFLKNYSALSENGRNTLFASAGKESLKRELDALATVATQHKNLVAMGNHSGTGGVAAILTALASLPVAPAATVAMGAGASAAAAALAKPVRVREITRFAKAWNGAVTSEGGQATMRLALAALAKGLAEDTGGDANQIAERIMEGLQ